MSTMPQGVVDECWKEKWYNEYLYIEEWNSDNYKNYVNLRVWRIISIMNLRVFSEIIIICKNT